MLLLSLFRHVSFFTCYAAHCLLFLLLRFAFRQRYMPYVDVAVAIDIAAATLLRCWEERLLRYTAILLNIVICCWLTRLRFFFFFMPPFWCFMKRAARIVAISPLMLRFLSLLFRFSFFSLLLFDFLSIAVISFDFLSFAIFAVMLLLFHFFFHYFRRFSSFFFAAVFLSPIRTIIFCAHARHRIRLRRRCWWLPHMPSIFADMPYAI